MTRSQGQRDEPGPSTAKALVPLAESSGAPIDSREAESVLAASKGTRRKLVAAIGRLRSRCHAALIAKLRPILGKAKALAARYSLTVEHELSAVGIGIAVASAAFASYTIFHDGRSASSDPAKAAMLEWSRAGHANADVDPITTGSIKRPDGVAASDGLSGAGDGQAQFGMAAARLRGYVLRDVFEGVALVEGHDGITAVKPGFTLPEGHKVVAIERYRGKWFVLTTGGIIAGERQ